MSSDTFFMQIKNASASAIMIFTRIISLTLTKERYTPFFTLEFTADGIWHEGLDTKDLTTVTLTYGQTDIFFGRTAGISHKKTAGRDIVSGRAFGFTKALSTSDALPGMMFDCTLADIAAANPTMPNVGYQQISDSASYIYVKESDTVWTAIAALSIKLYEQYPYITGMNRVNIKKLGQTQRDYSSELITAEIDGNNFNNAVSCIHMQGTQGTYDYQYTDTEATRRGIMRERYIPLDRQWLSSPTLGLKHKMYFSRRGGVYKGFTYEGFKNEQLCDTVSINSGSLSYSGEVSKLILHADKRGVFTTVISYDDGYSEIVNNE